MLDNAITPEQARRFYDRIGATYDFGDRFEGRAKESARAALHLSPGLMLLNAGAGTGSDHALIAAAVRPGGIAVAFDLSPVMLHLSRERTASPVCRGDARALPFATATFDRVFSSYLLDLLPSSDLPVVLGDFYRVLRPGGRLVLLGLTEGVTLPSRLLITAWKAWYRHSPLSLGGCRPLRLTYPLLRAGFRDVHREVIIQGGMPSELLRALKPPWALSGQG